MTTMVNHHHQCSKSLSRRMSSFFVVVLLGGLSLVNTQRVKTGCFDAFPVSCDGPTAEQDAALLQLQPQLADPEALCTKLAVEIFPSTSVLLDQTLHGEFLNGIEENDPLCLQIRQGYHLCSWCASEEEFGGCFEEAYWQNCGGKPTQKELLESDQYPAFASEQDIDTVCEKINASYDVIFLEQYGLGMPSTIELCQLQSQAKHLCPGYCLGGCFDGPDGTPPSCEPYQGLVPLDPELDITRTCDQLDYDVMFFIPDKESLMDISTHAEYLKAVPGNSTLCHQAQQAYSECYWCADDSEQLCFSPENPPTCEEPEGMEANADWADADVTCFRLYTQIEKGTNGPEEYFNISHHADILLFPDNSTFCEEAQYYYHQCDWCHQIEFDRSFCSTDEWCQSNATIPDDFRLPPEYEALNMSISGLSCQDTLDLWESEFEDTVLLSSCYKDLFVHRQCPKEFCGIQVESLNQNYLGATSTGQKKALVWSSRAAAFLTFLGASFILYDILIDPKKRSGVYYQLLIGMALFDIVTALAWCFATAPLDEKEAYYVFGAKGTEATCKAQAFSIQLGFTSIFYNVSLATYYVLVVGYGWKEFQLKALVRYLHGLPLLTGLGLAFGGIPVYHWIEYGCHLETLPDADLWVVMVFVVAPLGISILCITGSMIVVYVTVRKQAAKAKKWRLGANKKKSKKPSLEQEVLEQCVFYVLAFYVTWPILFSVYLKSIDVGGPIGLTVLVAFVAPLQGFNNFLVYVRPRIKHFLKNREKPRISVVKKLRQSTLRRWNSGKKTGKKNTKDGKETFVSDTSGGEFSGVSGLDSSRHSTEVDYTMDPSALLALKDKESRHERVETAIDPSAIDPSALEAIPESGDIRGEADQIEPVGGDKLDATSNHCLEPVREALAKRIPQKRVGFEEET